MSITIGDINLDGLVSLSPWLLLALAGLAFLSRHFKLFIALLAALLPSKYCQQFLHVFKQLERPAADRPEGDPSGTPRRQKSRKRT